MLLESSSLGKLPVALQSVIGVALFAAGAYLVLYSNVLSQSPTAMFIAFVSIGVLYIAAGLPQMLEGVMTMLYKKKEEENK